MRWQGIVGAAADDWQTPGGAGGPLADAERRGEMNRSFSLLPQMPEEIHCVVSSQACFVGRILSRPARSATPGCSFTMFPRRTEP